jgi:catechol 2,3-dioxygenase-like lactoylglutathione lyase family enzyme
MLTDKKVKAFVIAADAAVAKKFYRETLGFKLLSEDGYGLEFEMSNALLRISIVAGHQAQPAKHTVLGWCVPDIYEAMELLKSKGIVFERYDFLQQDERDVWQAPGGTRVAWFADPNGNLLSIDQKG